MEAYLASVAFWIALIAPTYSERYQWWLFEKLYRWRWEIYD